MWNYILEKKVNTIFFLHSKITRKISSIGTTGKKCPMKFWCKRVLQNSSVSDFLQAIILFSVQNLRVEMVAIGENNEGY